MIEFRKEYVELLPYDKEDYLRFLDEDLESSTNWYGVSLQLKNLS